MPIPKEVNPKTMIIGIDCYKKLVNKKACLGFVATLDPSFTKFYSKTLLVDPKSDIFTGLAGLV